jgi:ATP-dependent helicase HrpB
VDKVTDDPTQGELPVAAALPALRDALAAGNAVLVAPPGAGKTTLVPPALLDAPWLAGGRIVMLEPRRLAARAAATRMAALRGESVGGVIGYRTRLDSAVSAATRVEVVTEGLLVRRLLSDPGLEGVGCVILDEVHERSLDADLALAFCLDLQRTFRPELRLLAMSATVDGARLSGLLGGPVVESAGRMHAVEIEHARRDIAAPRDLPLAMAAAVRDALDRHAGDILAFLPGMGEIRRVQAALAGCGAVVLPLHGELPAAEQDRALRPDPGGSRRVVLSTSLAETSLTVPGVRIVIDGGWRRTPSLDAASGLTRLVTRRISRAAAAQRAGRAGREAPGVAIRLWTTALHRGLPPFDRPEILESDLAGLALDCAAWGAAPADLPFPDPPPAGALAAATALLAGLGALDQAGRITQAGRAMAGLGAQPRLAAMMLAAADPAEAALACDLAALLEERDPLRAADAPVAIAARLAALRGDRDADARDANARDADAGDADAGAVARIRAGARRYRQRLRLPASTLAAGDPARLIAAAFPDRIAQRRGEPGSFRLSGGGGARLGVADPLSKAPLLAVAALEGGAGARIRLAAPLDPAALPAAVAATVVEQVETQFDPASGTVLARRRRRLGALGLEDRTESVDPAAAARLLAAAARIPDLPWTDAARALRARVALMRGLEPDRWPDWSDAALDADRGWLERAAAGGDLARLDLAAALRHELGWPLAARLDAALPTQLALPGGRASVEYDADPPLVAARAQAFYGLDATPLLADGRIRPRLALLSPAGRPVALTADLAAFWRGGWADARRDMRGRYPRHDWPERPQDVLPAPAREANSARPRPTRPQPTGTRR